jgi:hypothetical protein
VTTSLGCLGAQSKKQYVAVDERERGYDEATFVESLMILKAAGGECMDDLAYLRSGSRVAGTVSTAYRRRDSTAACQRHGSLVPDIADRELGVSAS